MYYMYDILLILPLFVHFHSNFLRAFVIIPCPRIFTNGKFHQISMYFPLGFPQAELQSSQISCRCLPVAASSDQLAPGSCQPEWSQDYWAYSFKKHVFGTSKVVYCWLESRRGCVRLILQESVSWQLLLSTITLYHIHSYSCNCSSFAVLFYHLWRT